MPTLTLRNTATTCTFAGETLLAEIASTNSLPISFGCLDGRCGACLVRVIAPAEHIVPPEPNETRTLQSLNAHPDERLACQCRVHSDVEIELTE